MLKVWKWYQQCLAVHPVKTQVISSGILWGLGDIGAQAITHRSSFAAKPPQHPERAWSGSGDASESGNKDKEFKINWRRVATTSMFGFAFVGPVGHYWYEYLDRVIRHRYRLQPKSLKFVTAKVAADGLLFGPLDLLIFFSYMGFATGKNVDQVKVDVKRDLVPSLAVGLTAWPLVQVANFWFVPVRYQLLYVNFFCLLDSSFLSWIEQQGDAPWKQWLTSSHPQENQNS